MFRFVVTAIFVSVLVFQAEAQGRRGGKRLRQPAESASGDTFQGESGDKEKAKNRDQGRGKRKTEGNSAGRGKNDSTSNGAPVEGKDEGGSHRRRPNRGKGKPQGIIGIVDPIELDENEDGKTEPPTEGEGSKRNKLRGKGRPKRQNGKEKPQNEDNDNQGQGRPKEQSEDEGHTKGKPQVSDSEDNEEQQPQPIFGNPGRTKGQNDKRGQGDLVKEKTNSGDEKDRERINGVRVVASASGAQESTTAVTTRTGATLTMTFARDLSSAAYEINVENGRKITQSHLHCARAGENGEGVVTLFNVAPVPGPGGINLKSGTLEKGRITNDDINDFNFSAFDECGVTINNIASLLAAIKGGLVYVNIHSEGNPAGEVRGQLFIDMLLSAPY